jgi:hypothetical protein
VIPTSDLLAGFLALTVPGAGQVGDRTALLVFYEGAGDLAHHFAAQVVAIGQIITRGGRKPNALLSQQRNAQLLHDQVSGKAAGVLDGELLTPLPSMRSRSLANASRPSMDRPPTHRGVVIQSVAGDLEAVVSLASMGTR